MCLDQCASDSDCRQDQGYVCAKDHGACMLPGFIGPKPPVCKGQAPKQSTRFGAPTLISAPARTKYAFEPTAALLPSGDLVVAYTAMNGIEDANDLETVVVRADGSVGAPHPLTSSKKRHFDPWMTTFGDEAVLVWLGHDGGIPDKDPTVALARSKDGESWTTPVAILDEPDCPNAVRGCADKPMVIGLPGKKGKANTLAAFYFSEVTGGLRARKSNDGSLFQPSVETVAGAYGDVYADGSGILHVVAMTLLDEKTNPSRFGDPKGIVEYASSDDGGATWSKPSRVSAEGDSVPFYFSNPQVVADKKHRRLHVLYPSGTPDGRWDIVLRTSADGGKTWTRSKVNDDAPCANHMTPTAALDPKTGEVYVLWSDNRDGKGRVVLSVCNGGLGADAKCSENEALSAPFAAYSFVRHAASWLGEYDVLIVDEKRRVLHAVFDAPIDEKGVATTRVFHTSAKLP